MDEEILEVEVELGEGQKVSMKIKESDDWSEIEKGTRAIMSLVNGQQMLVTINDACEDSGVSFKIEGAKHSYHYEGAVVSNIFVEVKD